MVHAVAAQHAQHQAHQAQHQAQQQHQQKQLEEINRAVIFQRLQQAARPSAPQMGMVSSYFSVLL